MRVIGSLESGSLTAVQPFIDAPRKGLTETGYVEGQSIAIEYRWADGYYDRMRGLAADPGDLGVDVILAGGAVAAHAVGAAASGTLFLT